MARRLVLPLLALGLLAATAAYLLPGLGQKWQFVLSLRATRLGGMLVVGAAIAVATVLFQTVSRNRILTPQIMGFDALFILLQTALVASLGPVGFAGLPDLAKFLAELALLVGASLLLFGTLLGRGTEDVARMILTGVILGILFRSASGFLARVLDPNEFAVVQSQVVASFSRVNAALLPWAAGLTGLAILAALRMARQLDVLALGRAPAVSLGLRHDLVLSLALILTAVLVAVATAMVGPMAFLGLIVVALARPLAGTDRHAPLIAVSILVSCLLLVLGQTLFERVLARQSPLPAVIEFAGGLVFFFLLLKGRVR